MSQATAADRFLTAWKRLEAEISSRWRASHKGTRDPDAVAMLAWAEKEHLLSGETARFLHSCRVARNAYAHVSFEGYDGPVTLPPVEVPDPRALYGDDRRAGNTVTTVQQAMSLLFQKDIRRRCLPGPGRPATDIAEVIRRRGTIYMLGRDDPYASASPLMTAVAEHVLDIALAMANHSPWSSPKTTSR